MAKKKTAKKNSKRGDEMAVRDDRGDVKQTTTGFRGPLMVQSLTSAKSKYPSLDPPKLAVVGY